MKKINHMTDAQLLAELVSCEIAIFEMSGGQFSGGTVLMEDAQRYRHEILGRMKGGE